jgi:glycosyltransferase involved in cell wall biosynthesis
VIPTGVLLIEPLGRGGVWEYTCHLGNALQRHARVVILTAADYDPCFLDAEVTVLPYVRWQRSERWWFRGAVGALVRRFTNAISYLSAVARAFRACPAAAYPVVHFEGIYWPPLVLATVVTARSQARCVAYTPHNSFSRAPLVALRRMWVLGQRWICASADIVIAHTSFDRGSLLDAMISAPEKIHVIPHGPYGAPGRVVSREEARSRLGLSSSGPYILLFGYVRPDKGLDEVLALLPGLIGELPNAKILVVGEDVGGFGTRVIGGLSAQLKAHVEFRPGFVPSDQLPEYFAASDVVCLPYRQASDSGVARWALAQLRPIIAYDVGGLRDALHDNALIRWVKAGDRLGLLRALVDVLRAEGPERAAQSPKPGSSLLTWADIAELTLVRYRTCLDGVRP